MHKLMTAPDVTGLLQDLTGDDIVTSKTTAEGSDDKTYWATHHLRPDLLPADVREELAGLPGLDLTNLKATGLLGRDSGGKAADDGVRRKNLVAWAGGRPSAGGQHDPGRGVPQRLTLRRGRGRPASHRADHRRPGSDPARRRQRQERAQPRRA